MALAVDSYEHVPTLADGHDLLNLAWTLDERGLLSIDVPALISAELAAEISGGLPNVNSYPVRDPYAEGALAAAVAAFFGRSGADAPRITCGAGVGPLLHGLAGLATAGTVYVIGRVYPDYPFWVGHRAGRCVPAPAGADVADHVTRAVDLDARVVFCERPALIGDLAPGLDELARLCAGLAGHDTVVLVDESNANYCPPDFSAVNLAAHLPNLAVLRGFSKAYGMGGLRLSYCASSAALLDRIRCTVPPLLASPLSTHLGRVLLAAGDPTRPLRAATAVGKTEVCRLFEVAGFTGVVASSTNLPYVFLTPDSGDARDRLERAGISGKFHAMWQPPQAGAERLYRLSVPLAPERMALLRSKMAELPA